MRLVYEPILPKEYTRLEYLECTGTQYIDTGYTITEEDNIDAIYDIMLTNNSSRGLMGYSLTQVGYWGKTASNTYELGGGNTQVATGNRDIVRFKRDVISTTRQDTDLYINGVVVGHAQRSTTAETGPFQIFACRGSFKMFGKLYSATLTINDEQIRKFIPALRNSDSEPGMYDIVTGTFYTNAGTGTFNYKISEGEDIVDNPRYQQIEYIESTGSQYIDTGFIPNQDTRIISEFEYTKDPGNKGFIFGAGYSATDRAFELYPWSNNWNSPYGNINIIFGTSASLLTSGKIYSDKNKNTILIRYSDGTEQTGRTDYTTFTVTNRSMWLFAINRGSTTFLADCVRLYSCKIYDNGKLTRNFIPVIRKIDDKPGMYDKITKQFYTNVSSGDDFLYGNKINQPLPKMYEKLEYLETVNYNENQYIDTGLFIDDTCGFEIDCQFSAANDRAMIGVKGEDISRWAHLMQGNQGYLSWNGVVPFTVDEPLERHIASLNFLNSRKCTYNGEKKYDITQPLNSGANQFSVCLFCAKWGSETNRLYASGRIYSAKISKDDKIIGHFQPALRKADNKPGMYDFITGQFFTNLGSNEFTYDFPAKSLSNSKLRLIKTGGYTIYDDLYKEVEYIESTGTQWIDTGFKLTSNSAVDILIEQGNDVSTNQHWFGARNLSSAGNGFGAGLISSKFVFDYNARVTANSITVTSGTKYRIVKDKANNNLYVNGTSVYSTANASATFTTSYNAFIFMLNDKGQSASGSRKGKVYYCKIWDNNVLVRDYVPVIRIGDNKPGMYDKKNRAFYTNAGTGEFLYPTPTLTKPLRTRVIMDGSI